MRPFSRNQSFKVYCLPRWLLSKKLFFIILVILLTFGFFVKQFPQGNVTAFASIKTMGVINVAENNLQEVLDASIPMLAISQEEPKPDLSDRLVAGALYALAGIEIGKPDTFLQSEIPYLSDTEYQVATAEPELIPPGIEEEKETSLEEDSLENEGKEGEEEKVEEKEKEKEEEKEEGVFDSDKPLVAIYHTHTGEAYALSDGTVRAKGQRGGVYLAGQELKRVLEEEYGIGVIHSDVIHDYDYTKVYPYGASEKTVEKILEENPSVQIVIDVHRDAVQLGWERSQAITEINGENYATMYLVVGSDTRLQHPQWRTNLQFARQVSNKVDEMYPGLLRRDPKVQDGRYNQHLHLNAILVEIGEANTNYTEEAIRTARLFADALAEVLKEMQED